MKRPAPNATVEEIAAFVRAWVALAAERGFEAALAELDSNDKVPWSQQMLDELTFDHFYDGKQPRITDPAAVPDLGVGVYPYHDGSGFWVDHDLAMDGRKSDFTAQFDFRRTKTGFRIILADVHIL